MAGAALGEVAAPTETEAVAGGRASGPWPARQAEGGQRAAGARGVVAGALPAGCEGPLGPRARVAAHGLGQSWARAHSATAVAGAGRAAAGGEGPGPAGCGCGEQGLASAAGRESGKPRVSPVGEPQRWRAWAQVVGAVGRPQGPLGQQGQLLQVSAAFAAVQRSPSRSRYPGGWGCWGTCCDCPGRCLWGHCRPHR